MGCAGAAHVAMIATLAKPARSLAAVTAPAASAPSRERHNGRLANDGICVSTICPGSVKIPMVYNILRKAAMTGLIGSRCTR